MDILALIPARSGSKGIPDKNIRMLAGKPLIAHSMGGTDFRGESSLMFVER
jgi:CMP-N-acetylneuraminic acid synthetase